MTEKNTVYVIIVQDRHTEITAYAFSDSVIAVKEARQIAKAYSVRSARGGLEYYCEYDFGREDGWLFFAYYTEEGDCVRVVALELDIETNVVEGE